MDAIVVGAPWEHDEVVGAQSGAAHTCAATGPGDATHGGGNVLVDEAPDAAAN